ncbi:sigma-54 dependent transcriptional regulator [Rheinheimera sp. UJ63]|uniref:sigma-54 dependent transcriptional regulator n=1 Tax=Rheinheimera sp. UJ63 TaxID=2910157 RepID=UPI001F2AEE01|nr:sigma-54-dependent Fis family transcriptional regulator [Rheinheimera sp. UJ63]MCF4009093.1 sigma-54-dependent Fis family transcriptional regulator [Rheinheimera sp. UJ63]
MSDNPHLYLVDLQLNRCERLSTVCSFIGEAHQLVSPADLANTLQHHPASVVVFGAIDQLDASTIIRQFPASAFLVIGDSQGYLLEQANVIGVLSEPFSYNSLTQLLRDAQQYHRLLPTHKQQDNQVRFDGMVGQTPAMQKIRFLIQQVAKTEANVLVLGPSGTGKEVVARNIHLLSNRANGPFVPINCGAIPAELLESELFGHEKGAFTGAISTRKGRFELAQGGTLFLDEIGDMPQPMQVKLLRVLQERIFERVGGSQTLKADVRIIAATHRDLEVMITDGSFREDLYYRLNVFPIDTPALCDRADDLPILINELLNRQYAAHQAKVKFTERALDSLKLHSWPGNVRELANLLERMVIMYPDQIVDVAELPKKYQHLDVESYQPVYPEELQERDLLNALFQSDDSSDSEEAAGFESVATFTSVITQDNLPEEGLDLKEYLAELEIRFISQALERHDFVVARAADILGLRRTTLVEKMRKYNLGKDE